MKIQPINKFENSSIMAKNNTNFKAKLNLQFPASSIGYNPNKGEASFERVISSFRSWLANQHPYNETLTIRKKSGKMVQQRVVKGAGGDFYENRQEDLEFAMGSGRSGFCWNPQGSEYNILDDFKSTFEYVKQMAGY